jgi:hypothetical protein
VKVGLPGNQARDKAEILERIKAIELVPMMALLTVFM